MFLISLRQTRRVVAELLLPVMFTLMRMKDKPK